jgi:hypothetical protein
MTGFPAPLTTAIVIRNFIQAVYGRSAMPVRHVADA